MTGRAILVASLLCAVAWPTRAQMMPPTLPGMADSRIRTIEYRNDQVVTVSGAPGYQVTIELASDERIESVALGDSGAWQVTANKAGNLLFVKALSGEASTNMTVVTDVRTYNFELSDGGGAGGDLPYAIRFRYPAGVPGAMMPGGLVPGGPTPGTMVGEYRLRGSRSLFPDAISDDGAKTFIEWAPDGPLPAVYSQDPDGAETLVNGNMRGQYFVIDGVSRRLIFRIDGRRARADRTALAVPK